MNKLPEWMLNTPMALRGMRLKITLMTDEYIFVKYPTEEYYCLIKNIEHNELSFSANFLQQKVKGTISFIEIRNAIELLAS